jgi:hypothetical protein
VDQSWVVVCLFAAVVGHRSFVFIQICDAFRSLTMTSFGDAHRACQLFLDNYAANPCMGSLW